MTAVQVGIAAQLVGAVVTAGLILLTHHRIRNVVGGIGCAAVGACGVLTGSLAMEGRMGGLRIPTALTVGAMRLAPDPLGGVFLAVAGAVGVLVSIYAIGYAQGPAASRSAWLGLVTFLLGMQLVPQAADAVSLLLGWELMAVGSTVLVLAEQASGPQVRSAAVWYAAMTHLSMVLILAGFAVLSAAAGSTAFDDLRNVPPHSTTASLAFVLLGLGFATKAGLVPLHVWLPGPTRKRRATPRRR